MKRSVFLAAALALVVYNHHAPAGGKPSAPKQLQFSLRVYKGDPLGSEEAGAIKVVAEPRLVTLEGNPFSFLDGGEIPVAEDGKVDFIETGRAITAKTSAVKDGKVRLDITLSNVTVKEQSKKRTELHTEQTRTILSLREGQVVKLRWPGGRPNKQTWLELKMTVLDQGDAGRIDQAHRPSRPAR